MEGIGQGVARIALAKDFEISRIIKGGWQLSSGHQSSFSGNPIEDMVAFAKAGVTTFDCADIYTGVEELIGRFLKVWREQNGSQQPIRVLTKFVPDADELDRLDRHYVTRIIDRSLRRLGQDQLDMVQFSWWNYGVDRYVETAGWLVDLQREGKIRMISATNFNTTATARLLEAGIPIKTIQLQYSLLDNRPEKGLSELCLKNDVKLLCYGTVAGGFISERWLNQPEPAEPMDNRSLTKYKLMIDETGGWETFQHLLNELSHLAIKHHVSITNVASQYMLSRPAVGGLIIGAGTANHLKENLRTFEFQLDADDLAAIGKARAQLTSPEGDVWDLERIKEGPHGKIMRYNLNAQAGDN